MGISSLLMLLVLFRLNPVSLFLAKLWLGRREHYKEAFVVMAVNDD